MRILFSALFERDLAEAEARYTGISAQLGANFRERVKANVRVIAQRMGGDHVGSHGFRCRHCRPFPNLICYEIEERCSTSLGWCTSAATRTTYAKIWATTDCMVANATCP